MADTNQVGFIIDAPNVLIKTSKRDVIIDKADSGSVTFGADFIDISGGWSFAQLTRIQKSNKITIKVSNAEFSTDQIATSTGADIITGSVAYNKFGDIYTVATNKITIPDVVVTNSIRINGFKEVTTAPAATGEFKVTIAADSTDITFFTDVADGTEIKPSYQVMTAATANSLSAKVTSVPGSGEFVITFPIYASDSVDSDIVNYGQFIIYKASIEQNFTAGASYKSASKFELNATCLNPQRADKKLWDFVLLPAA